MGEQNPTLQAQPEVVEMIVRTRNEALAKVVGWSSVVAVNSDALSSLCEAVESLKKLENEVDIVRRILGNRTVYDLGYLSLPSVKLIEGC